MTRMFVKVISASQPSLGIKLKRRRKHKAHLYSPGFKILYFKSLTVSRSARAKIRDMPAPTSLSPMSMRSAGIQDSPTFIRLPNRPARAATEERKGPAPRFARSILTSKDNLLAGDFQPGISGTSPRRMKIGRQNFALRREHLEGSGGPRGFWGRGKSLENGSGTLKSRQGLS